MRMSLLMQTSPEPSLGRRGGSVWGMNSVRLPRFVSARGWVEGDGEGEAEGWTGGREGVVEVEDDHLVRGHVHRPLHHRPRRDGSLLHLQRDPSPPVIPIARWGPPTYRGLQGQRRPEGLELLREGLVAAPAVAPTIPTLASLCNFRLTQIRDKRWASPSLAIPKTSLQY